MPVTTKEEKEIPFLGRDANPFLINKSAKNLEKAKESQPLFDEEFKIRLVTNPQANSCD